MSEIKWIKIAVDIFDDEKIYMIESLPAADTIITIWFKLLCLAGKQNNGGVFVMNNRIAYTDQMLASVFRRELATVRLALSTFESLGMIEIIEGVITIPNWEKHQSLDALEKAKEQNKLRQARFKEKQRLKIEQMNNVTGNVTDNVLVTQEVTPGNAHRIKNKNKELEIEEDIYNGASAPKRIDYSEEFNKFWSIYPRTEAKSEAYKSFNARLKEGVPSDKLIQAAENYASICKKERKEKKYILQAKTFLGPNLRFEDYIPKEPEKQQLDEYDNPFDYFFEGKK